MGVGESGYGLIPVAMTPVRSSDLLAGLLRHHANAGREGFRQAIASYLGSAHVATYTTFRRAIVACLRRLNGHADHEGSEVLLPAYSCPDFFVAIEAAGLEARRCDLEPETLAIDPAALAARIDENTLAVIAVNHLGLGNRMDAIASVCENQDCYLIEDLGYALGAEFEGQPLGSVGDCTVLNFQEGKAIPVGGGMVTSNRQGIAVSDAGREPSTPNRAMMTGYALCASPVLYRVYNDLWTTLSGVGLLAGRVSTHTESKRATQYTQPFTTMSNFQGTIARRVFDRLDDHRHHRVTTARRYERALADCAGVHTVDPVDGLTQPHYIRYPILVSDPEDRSPIRQAIRDTGVQTSTLYNALEIDGDRYPGAEWIRRRLITLPTHPGVSRAVSDRVTNAIRQTVDAEPSTPTVPSSR